MKRPKALLLTTLLLIVGLLVRATPANAFEIATPVSPTGNAWEWGSANLWNTTFSYPIDTTYYTKQQTAGSAIFIERNGYTAINTTGKFVLNAVRSSNAIEFKKGYYYSTILNFSIQSRNQITNGESFPSINRITLPGNAPYKVMSISNSWVPCADTPNVNGYCTYGGVSWNIIVQATQDHTGYFQLGTANTDMVEWVMVVGTNAANYGTIRLEPITEFAEFDVGDINKEQQQAGEQAQQDGQQGSSSSQSDATQGTQSLLNAITGFVGVISNATPTNCRITGDMGALDLGQLDFCQDNPPAIIQIIGSLILIAVTIPIVIWTVKKIISMFRSFTNG